MMFDDSKVSYELTVEHEEMAVRGNAMASGDDDYDREVENAILRRSSVWAWACVKCTARYNGIDCLEGIDYLGGCSYKDEADFTAGGYWDSMKNEAREDLYRQLESVITALGGL